MGFARKMITFSIGLLGCSTTNMDTPDAMPLSRQATAVAALQAVYGDKNLSAVDTYFDAAFIRHDPGATGDGTVAFKTDVAGALPGLSWNYDRVFEEGDYVVVHDEYDNLLAAGVHSISFDLFRFANDKIAEHWTCKQTDPGTYASGHTMVDGPTTADPAADTTASEDIVSTPGKGFVPVVIVGGAFSELPNYLSPTFAQHDPLIADGLMGLGAAFSSPPLNSLAAVAVPESVGEHDFVFTRSKGTITWDALKPNSPNNPTVYCDLFHVQAGLITEHWDVIQADPNSSNINDIKTNAAGHTLWN